ncbi:MAG: hypothetical protein Q8O00_13695 [Holophaga sp.]|nr:hypothetical protein [Holophaga sp.]
MGDLQRYLASIRLGYRDRVTPPVITLGSPTLNRSNTALDVGFQGLAQQGTATLYRLDGTANAANPTPVLAGSVSVNLATWVVNLPAHSVSTIVVE